MSKQMKHNYPILDKKTLLSSPELMQAITWKMVPEREELNKGARHCYLVILLAFL